MKVREIILFILAISSCMVHAQRKPKIKGNKSVVAVSTDLPAFNAIELNDDLEINLEKSTAIGYTITADDNLIDVLKFKVVDSTLVITSFYKVTGNKEFTITVHYDELRNITLRKGEIAMEDMISSDELTVKVLGSSRINLKANASIMSIQMEDNSKGDFRLESDSLRIELKDKIDATIYSVSEKNSLTMSKNAMAVLEGTTDTLQIKLSDNVNLKAQKLEAGLIYAQIEETSTARIYAYKLLELSAKGSSKTYLWGNPKIEILEFLDTSELYKKVE